MFPPTGPSSGKCKNLRNTWEVNYNIKFCKKEMGSHFLRKG